MAWGLNTKPNHCAFEGASTLGPILTSDKSTLGPILTSYNKELSKSSVFTSSYTICPCQWDFLKLVNKEPSPLAYWRSVVRNERFHIGLVTHSLKDKSSGYALWSLGVVQTSICGRSNLFSSSFCGLWSWSILLLGFYLRLHSHPKHTRNSILSARIK